MLKWFVNSGWWLGNRHSPLRRGISLVFSLSSLVLFSACTDYVSQIEDRYGEWKIDPSTVEKGLMTDSRDGQTYETVKIGTQMWMAQNLNYETANSYCYRDSAKYCSKYGRYYTWAAAKKACPSGWHLPTEADFKTLIGAVGGASDASYVLKSTNGWNDAGIDFSGNGTDDYSFAAFPAGNRYYSNGDYGVGSSAEFWSSTEDDRDSDYAVHLYLSYTDVDNYASGEILYGFYKENGLSVRCIKDEKFSLSAITTKSGSSQKAKSSSSSIKSSSSISQKSSSSVAKLSSSSVVKSSSSQKTVSSSSGKVTEPAEVTVGSMTDSRDGKTYKTVTIGTQTWMAQNLNYETSNSYCYNDDVSYCTKYGRLYTWAAAMDSAGIWSTNGKGCGSNKTCSPTYPVRGVCPQGWHLPSKAEWETLFNAVGGSSVAGTKLKSTSGWYNSGNGTDAFSFSALPAGDRYSDGNCYYEGIDADFWSSTEISSYNAYDVFLRYDDGNATLFSNYKYFGFSVRCLKDDASGHLANSSSSLKKYSSSSTVKSSSSVKITSSSSAKIMSLSSSSTKQSSSSIDLDYYNRQMQGQKGSGLSWKASDGPFVQINENGVKTDWYYWTDSENGGSSGFNRGSVPNIADEKGSGKYTLKEVESIGGVGGKAVLGPSFMMKDSVFHVGSVESGFSGGSIKLPADKMLGLCLEYTNTFDYFVIQIIYDNDEANNWGRPEFHLPIATEKKIINLPWAVFQKISDWAFADVSVYDAIKVMKGVNFQAINNSSKEVFGEFVISKIGAYGTCDD